MDMDQLPYGLRCELLDAYGTWVTDTLDQGYTGYLTTFMFNFIPGHPQSIIGSMTKDIKQFYRTLVTRVVRNARKAQIHQLPKLIALPDRPVRKHFKQALQDVVVNDGLHVHGITMIPERSRLDCELDEHVRSNSRIYTDSRYTRIRHIDVQRIKTRPGYTTEYAFKWLKRDPTAYEHIVILPVAKSELPPKELREPTPAEPTPWEFEPGLNLWDRVPTGTKEHLRMEHSAAA
jgi:hypothetical protein